MESVKFGIEIPNNRILCQYCMGTGKDIPNSGSPYRYWKVVDCPKCRGLKHVRK